MKVVLTYLFLALGSSLIAQKTTHMFGPTFVPSIYQKTSTLLLAQKLEYGVEYSSGWNFHGGLGFFNRNSEMDYQGASYISKGMIGSFSITRRLMTSTCILSPVGGLTFGSVFFNSRSQSTYEPLVTSKANEMPEDVFEKLRFFAKAKMQMEVDLGNVRFRGGPSYTFYETRSGMGKDKRMQSSLMVGYGFEFGLFYTLKKHLRFDGIYLAGLGKV